MTRKIVSWLSFMAVSSLVLLSCRNDYIPEHNKTGNPKVSKFKILKLDDVPRLKTFIQKESGRQDLLLPLSKKNNQAKTMTAFGEINASLVVEKTNGNETYYIMSINNSSHNNAVYNLEIKQIDDVEVKSEVIEYISADRSSINLLNFTGRVSSYTLRGDPIHSSDYNEGEGGCPPGGGVNSGYNGSDDPNPGADGPYYGGSSSCNTDPITDTNGCWEILLNPEKPWLTLGYYNNCTGYTIYAGQNKNGINYSADCGDGSGTVITNPQSSQDIIITDLQAYPCAQSVAQQLPTLPNDLAAAMRQIFQNNENYNITFRPRSNMGNVDGVTFTSHSNTGGFTAIISLNDQVLAHATKEYILVTMYHEVIHAFLDYEKLRLGDTAFHDQYPGVIVGYDYTADGTVINRYTYIEGHQQLIPFLTTLQNILSTYNPNLPNDVVVAMARTGITTTTQAQHQLNSNEKNTTLGNHKGTACP